MAGPTLRRLGVAFTAVLLAGAAFGAASPVLAREPTVAARPHVERPGIERRPNLRVRPQGLRALARGHVPIRPLAATPQPGDVTGIDIKVADGRSIAGTVTDGSDPLADVFVVACTPDPELNCISQDQTAANGTFTIRGLPPGDYVLAMVAEDPSDVVLSWFATGGPEADPADATAVDTAGGNATGLDLEPFIGHRISGSVHGTGNVALAGVVVIANGTVGGGGALTDLSGNFTIHALPDDDYSLTIQVPASLNFRGGPVVGGTAVDPFVVEEGDAVSVSGANVIGQDITAPTGLKISGTLSGSEASGSTVSAFGGLGHETGEVDVASNGTWQLGGLWPDDYQVHFDQPRTSDDIPPIPLGDWNGIGEPLSVTTFTSVHVSTTNRTGINATIPVGLSLSGKVTGSDGPLGSQAYLFICGDPQCYAVFTGPGGTWSLKHIVPDAYSIQAWEPSHIGGYFGPGGFAVGEDLATKVTVGPSSRSGVDVVLPAGIGITGTITDPADRPIEGAYVVAAGSGGIGLATSGFDITGADGTFRLPGVGSDSYTIHVGFDLGTDHLDGFYDNTDPDNFTTDFANATPILLPHQALGTTYVPIAPQRIVDSRTPLGVTGVFQTGVPRTFSVAGVGAIPADAVAVTGNVTVVGQTAAGYVALTPTATANPTSSTINVPVGDVRANNFSVPLAGNGKLSAVWKGAGGSKSHVVVDVTGYFVADETHATYTAIPPVRVMDTRPATHAGTPTTLAANVPQTLSVAGAHGIPSDAVAITGNLTVVGQTKPGYVAVTPDATASPTTSTINVPVGDVRANGVSAPLNVDGDLSVVYKAPSGTANVVLDITGYYTNDTSGLLYFPVPPGRAMDTRPNVLATGLAGTFSASSPRELVVAGRAQLPLDAAALTGNLTVVGQTAAGYAAITTESTATPTTSTLNFPVGDVRANGVTVPVNIDGGFWLVYKAGGGKTTHLIFDVTGYYQ